MCGLFSRLRLRVGVRSGGRFTNRPYAKPLAAGFFVGALREAPVQGEAASELIAISFSSPKMGFNDGNSNHTRRYKKPAPAPYHECLSLRTSSAISGTALNRSATSP